VSVLLLAIISTSCGSSGSEEVLTVEQAVPRIEELNGQTVSVAGYLASCGGYDCTLFRNKDDADEWDRYMAHAQANERPSLPFPDHPILGIGSGTNFDFDAKAAPFTNSYVVITGTMTNECRFEGKPACTDRGPDLKPTAIRAEGR
jgi:hypothetical protein